MADNVFDLLNDEEREEREERVEENEEKKEVNQQMNIPSPEENVPLITTIDQNGDNNWTDVSSTKTRKTAIPVASLFKQQPKQDDTTKTNTAPVPAPAPSTAAQAADSASKKKGTLFCFHTIHIC